MAYINECSVRPLLRVVEFYRLYKNYKACDVFPAFYLPYELDFLESTPTTRDTT